LGRGHDVTQIVSEDRDGRCWSSDACAQNQPDTAGDLLPKDGLKAGATRRIVNTRVLA
jgi:hypothetical protein